MSEPKLDDGDAPSVRQPGPLTGKLIRPTIGLSTVLLGVATIAVAIGNWQTDKEIQRLKHQMRGLREVARELVIDDPAMFAVVKRKSQWFGESIFDVHLPDGESWQLCIALDKVGKVDLADPLARLPLLSGRRAIEVRYEKEKEESIARLLVDGVQVFEEVRPKDWEPRRGSGESAFFNSSTKCDTTRPLVLYRRRFRPPINPTNPNIPTPPSAGLLVWIEKAKNE